MGLLMGRTSLPCKPSGGMKVHRETSLATQAQHPPRLSTHRPASELAPTIQQRREGAGGSLGEAPFCCCQAFPFKARARSGYSPFPPALTTNPLTSSSLLGSGASIPSGTAPGQEKGSLAGVCQHPGGTVGQGGTGPSPECPSVPSLTSTLSFLHSLTSFSNLTHHPAAALGLFLPSLSI